ANRVGGARAVRGGCPGSCGARSPDGRVRVLELNAPGIDVTEMVVLAFPAERSRRCPALEDKIVALLEALAVVHRVRIGPPGLDTNAAHESREHAAARNEVGHGKLLGQADGIFLDRKDVA